MILNNFKNLLFGSMTGCTSLNVIAMDGTEIVYSNYPIIGYSSMATITYAGGNTTNTDTSRNYFNGYSLTFGSGTTEVTADDYQMENPYDTTNHFSFDNCTQSYSFDGRTKTIAGTITNTSEENLTVSEIGVITLYYYNSYRFNHTLIARSLITPVTIAPAETKTFQYTLDFSGIAG